MAATGIEHPHDTVRAIPLQNRSEGVWPDLLPRCLFFRLKGYARKTEVEGGRYTVRNERQKLPERQQDPQFDSLPAVHLGLDELNGLFASLVCLQHGQELFQDLLPFVQVIGREIQGLAEKPLRVTDLF